MPNFTLAHTYFIYYETAGSQFVLWDSEPTREGPTDSILVKRRRMFQTQCHQKR